MTSWRERTKVSLTIAAEAAVETEEDEVERTAAILGILAECGALELISPQRHGEHGEGAERA